MYKKKFFLNDDDYKAAGILSSLNKIVSNVDMYEVVVSEIKTGNEILISQGVGPCICIILHGKIFNKPFILMHHWEGFYDDNSRLDLSVINNLAMRYFLKIKSNFRFDKKHHKNTAIIINKLDIIGGQKKRSW